MNKQRRSRLAKILETLEDAKIDLETEKDEEQEAFDNIPESLQNGERGEQAQAYCSSLDDAFDSLESAIESIQEAIA